MPLASPGTNSIESAKISARIYSEKIVKESLTRFNEYICTEILADSIELVEELANGTEIEVNDILLKVFVTKKA